MTYQLIPADKGSYPPIPVQRPVLLIGRHPACDARLDSLRVSRHHCCMMQESDEVVVRDLGSTNGIRINGQRVEMGRLKPGDELSIAHIRYRLDNGQGHDQTLADPAGLLPPSPGAMPGHSPRSHQMDLKNEPYSPEKPPLNPFPADENALAAAVRKILPSAVAEKCQIQVIVQMTGEKQANGESPISAPEIGASENVAE